jgi:hypothetical protein
MRIPPRFGTACFAAVSLVVATEARLDAMAPYVSQSGEGLTQVQHENGAISIDLQDRFQSVSVARVATDGSAVVRCVTTRPEAEQFVTKDAKTRPGKASSKKARATKPAVRTASPSTTAMTTTTAPLEEK